MKVLLNNFNPLLLYLITFVCVSCNPAQTPPYVPIPSDTTTLPNITITPFPSPITSTVEIATYTPTLNPLIINVLTATHELGKLSTRTPLPSQQCPEINQRVTPNTPKDSFLPLPDFDYSESIMEYLNAGGSPQVLKNYLSLRSNLWAEKDVTGDNVPELLVSIRGLNIFMCEESQYTNIGFIPFVGDQIEVKILSIDDMNHNGISEIILEDDAFSAGLRMYRIYEWDGHKFQSLIWPDTELMGWFATPKGRAMDWYGNWAPNYLWGENSFRGIASSISVTDLDSNGTKELVLHNQIPPVRHRGYSPWRVTTDIYRWNGVIFMLDEIEIEPPVYRFQAVQDADRLSLLGNYQEAIKLYQGVIVNDSLYAWSEHNYTKQLDAEGHGIPTPTSIPYFEEEYRNLAAYAQYRILLLQILQGELESSQTTYEALQKEFRYGTTGHQFAMLAYDFWQEYKSSMDLGKACLQAVKYAEAHEADIFTYIGNSNDDYSHGVQSHYYTPADLCPFD